MRSGGAERLVVELAKRHRKAGMEVEVALMDATPTPMLVELTRAGVPVHELGNGYRQMWNPLLLFRIRKLIKVGRYDIVHTHNTPAQLLTFLACHVNGVSYVTTEHNTFNRRRVNRLWKYLDSRMYAFYDKVVTVGDTVRDRLLENLGPKFDPAKVAVVPNGVDLLRFRHVDKLWRPGDGEFRLLMAANFREQKDQATLIRAMTLLPSNVKLILAGEGETMSACRKLSIDLGVADKVEFPGQCGDIPSLLADTHVAVLSSRYEGMPMFLLEAMAAGVPIVASNVEGIKELLAGNGLLFEKGDEKEFARIILELMRKEGLYNSFSRNSMRSIHRFDINLTASNYKKIYKNLK